MTVLARNTPETGDDGVTVPVIIEDAERFRFAEGERERDWHEASDEEHEAYLAYWNAQYDAQQPAP